jgi:hypothetical protein
MDDNGQDRKVKILELKPDERKTITLKKILDNLRHSIAHQAIRPTKVGDNWEGVLFRNYGGNDKATAKWDDDYVFQLYLTQNRLKKFAKFIASKYLEEI